MDIAATEVASIAAPLEPVSGLRWCVSPLTLQWIAPRQRGVISYRIRIIQNGVTLPSIATYRTSYSFTGLTENALCIFSVHAVYASGESSGVILTVPCVPPYGLSFLFNQARLMNGLAAPHAFHYVFYHAIRRNMCATTGNMLKWMTGVASAWNWVNDTSSTRVSGTWLGWNWDPRNAAKLTDAEKVGWMTLVINQLDLTLFQLPALFILPTNIISSLKSRGEWTTWWNRLNTWMRLPMPSAVTLTWNEPTESDYGAAVDEMISIRSTMTTEQMATVWFWSCSNAYVWWWFALEWLRCVDVPITDQVFLFMDLIYGCEMMRQQITQWPLRDTPMAWIRTRRGTQLVPTNNGTPVRGSVWSSENGLLQDVYLSRRALYGTIFQAVMTKWFGDSIASRSFDYRFLSCAVPFSEQVIQSGTYGQLATERCLLAYSSWITMCTSAGMAEIGRGENIRPAIVSSVAAGYQLFQSYSTILSTRDYPTPSPAPSNPTPTPNPSPTNPTPTPAPTFPTPTPTVPTPAPVTPTPTVPTPTPPYVEPYRMTVNYLTSQPPAVIGTIVAQAITIIQSIIVQTHGKRDPSVSSQYDMIVDVDIQALSPNILANSRPTVVNTTSIPMIPLRQCVTLNSNTFSSVTTTQSKLNGQWVSSLLPILIHEMIHGLGIASYVVGSSIIGWDQMLDSTKTWYTGKPNETSYAIQAYQRAAGSAVQRIPVENSFGAGTAYSHWEEGLQDGFSSEKRYYDYGQGPVYHPPLTNEIMSGMAGSVYYFSDITAGALKDHGYVVNLSSPSVVPYPGLS